MRYVELRRHVWMLWERDRYGYVIDPTYREWIVARTVERVINATLHHDDAPAELGAHLLHDYTPRLDPVERPRFQFWWQHVMEYGFDGENPLRHLHKPTVKAGTK
ncbi:hypothetical protein ACFFGR_09320 [Arthrobacter liuii]|uniref:hypothetical protein n=1 Tax=Arthrobacter liuii TaxID=1476996 RepID=UPI00166D4EDA|nr:hypothetical protein [Arthrobacter liuii]